MIKEEGIRIVAKNNDWNDPYARKDDRRKDGFVIIDARHIFLRLQKAEEKIEHNNPYLKVIYTNKDQTKTNN